MTGLLWHPEAIEEARAAYEYLQRETGADVPPRFQFGLERAVADIEQAPDRWPLIRPPSIRRKLLGRPFRYALIYRHDEHGTLVLAVVHQRRKPGYWLRRT